MKTSAIQRDIIDKALTDEAGERIDFPVLCTNCTREYPGREWMQPDDD